jgi:radical SAM superfamily enzyme with C-terminal helix-hairpin-helix motif
LKLRRAISKYTPTPIDERKALENLVEEIADVSLSLKVLGIDNSNPDVCLRVVQITNQKMDRWLERLADKGK